MVQSHGGTGNELRQRNVDASAKPLTTTDEGRKVDQLLDEHQTYEFGGPAGVTAMMVGFPMLMYYLWICLWFYDGKLVYPASSEDIVPFLGRMWAHIRDDASPNAYAWKVYTGLVVYQLFLALVMPGYKQEGLPVPSLGYKTLMYNCNALYSLYATMLTAAALHYYHIFRLTEIIDNYGHIMSVAMIYGFAVSFGMYFITVAAGNEIRMSGNLIYDVFMGACLNPRIGSVDLKMWAEVRIPWVIVSSWPCPEVATSMKQYGYNMAFMILATWLYLNACAKGEECIPQTWDMYHEKWGFMVIFWNFAGVPFTYVYSVVYMASHHPSNYQFSTPTYVILFVILLTAYCMYDFTIFASKCKTQGITTFRNTFPQLPGGTLKNPEFIQTAHGNRLLISGWWRYSRKPNYVADWTMSFCWGAVIGILIHRCGRDFERCSIKYGKDWEHYCSVVKYKFIPGSTNLASFHVNA
ncbi:ERG4 ERG24 ergosterol biosynthesis protein [Suillus subaureus]|uniref:Delta(24(24(1)))-sterol reductase n=1 Tax=Suillus subaureus TaxID=48587 RepID=A0A9P7E1F4_9AGAM|nr:ERG4 ERG24 ergosterol biosynthesis protein [Suillus subaureus]KAG1808748.1 ERG4 ERG24 ergosterol biosynthesis protein [Suillus subaureus]